MKSSKVIIIVVTLIIAFAATTWWLRPELPVYYTSPEVSAVLFDSATDQPIPGAIVKVSWGTLRHKPIHGSDSFDLHIATAVTDEKGVFTIPAWGPVAASKEWIYYAFEPSVSFSKPGYKADYVTNHNNQDSVTRNAIPGGTVTLERPSWHGQRIQVQKSDGKGDRPH